MNNIIIYIGNWYEPTADIANCKKVFHYLSEAEDYLKDKKDTNITYHEITSKEDLVDLMNTTTIYFEEDED